MVTRADIVATARTWLETPFVHQARLKGVGVDCAGLLIGVANELGLSDFDVSGYTMRPEPAVMIGYLDDHMDSVELSELGIGDVLCLRVEMDPQHLAIITEVEPRLMMIHSFSFMPVRKCVEHGVGEYWLKRVIRCYRFRGVEQ